MSKLFCHLLKTHSRSFLRNGQHVRHHFHQGAYEGDGKTTVTILNRDADYGMMVDKLTMHGFVLNLGINVLGPMIIFPRTVIGWNIASVEDINEDSLVLFKVLEPKPDILLLGLDKTYPRETPFLLKFKNILGQLGIRHEILPVEKACTTFNFLTAEKRYVVGAFLPPSSLDVDPDSLIEMGVRRYLHQPWMDPEDPSHDKTFDNDWRPKELRKHFDDQKKNQKKLIPENVPPPKSNL